MNLDSSWARDFWARTFWRQFDVTLITEDEAKTSDHFVDPYTSADIDALFELMDTYQDLAMNFDLGDDFGQYSAEAKKIFEDVCEEIGQAYDNGYIHSMTCQLYIDRLNEAWKQLLDSQVNIDYNAEGNYSLYRYNSINNVVVYDAETMSKNENTPWGFYAYPVASGTYAPFESHDTGSKFGSSEIAAWYRSNGEWLYIADNGNVITDKLIK